MKRGKIIVIPEAITPWFFIPDSKELEMDLSNDNMKMKKEKRSLLYRILRKILNK